MDKKEFTKLLQNLDQKYYNNESEISDSEYDALREEYEKRFGKYEYIGASVQEDEVLLPYYLGSMDKIKRKDTKLLSKWLKKHQGPYRIEDKEDGVSGLLVFKNGKVRLFTRGDGTYGSEKINIIKFLNLPKINDNISVRGEIIISKKNFERFSKDYKNPRNLVSGMVNSKTLKKDIAKYLDFIAYEIIEPRDLNSTSKLQELGFKTPNYIMADSISMDFLDETLDKFKQESPYEIDGIIISDISNIHPVNKKGNPDYAFAFKKNVNPKQTTIKQVIWTISKHGYLKPRVELEPVQIGGTTIQYATAFNAKYVKDNNIGPGTIVTIVRSGDVIPYIINIVKSTKAEMPKGIDYKWNDTNVDIIVEGDTQEQKIKQITHFFHKLDIKGISEKSVKKLVECGHLRVTDILRLTQEELIDCGLPETYNKKEIKTIITDSIKNVKLNKLMASTPFFGIGLGERKLKLLLPLIGKDLKTPTPEEVSNVDGFADKTINRFLEGFEIFKEFLKLNPEITYTIPKVKSAKYQGKKFVITGKLSRKRKELVTLIEEQGGKVSSALSKRTDYLVVGDNPGSKLEKAKKLKIMILKEEEF